MVNANGVIVPSTEDLNQAISMLLNNIQNNPQVNADFRTSPVDYFHAIGIATDAIPEIMADLGMQAEAAVASCRWWSCIFTSGCLWTSIPSSSISIVVTATPLNQP